jgi:hypothetical protein
MDMDMMPPMYAVRLSGIETFVPQDAFRGMSKLL